MSETPRLKLPLLDAAQAQKHVTVNEAIARADSLASARVESRSLATPPTGAVDGHAYIVGVGGAGDWSGQDGNVALFLNGGWAFLAPWSGMTLWVESEHDHVTYADGVWMGGHASGASGGAATLVRIIELDHVLSAGTGSTTVPVIPDKAIVLGVSARVIGEIGGASAWSLGVPGSTDRYGTGYGTAVGSFAHGVTGQPQAYFGATELEVTAEGGAFTSGEIRLAVHFLDILPPSAA